MIFQLKQIIKLRGKSQKGKQRLQRWGSVWFVQRLANSRLGIVAQSDDLTKPLPDSFRWLDLPADSDMLIV